MLYRNQSVAPGYFYQNLPFGGGGACGGALSWFSCQPFQVMGTIVTFVGGGYFCYCLFSSQHFTVMGVLLYIVEVSKSKTDQKNAH